MQFKHQTAYCSIWMSLSMPIYMSSSSISISFFSPRTIHFQSNFMKEVIVPPGNLVLESNFWWEHIFFAWHYSPREQVFRWSISFFFIRLARFTLSAFFRVSHRGMFSDNSSTLSHHNILLVWILKNGPRRVYTYYTHSAHKFEDQL